MKNLVKNFIFAILIFVIISGVFSLFPQPFKKDELSITQLVFEINQDKIKKIIVKGNELEIINKEGKKVKSRKELEVDLHEMLIKWGAIEQNLNKIDVKVEPPKEGVLGWLNLVLFGILPFLLFGLFFWMIIKQARMGVGQTFDFTRAKAKLFGPGGKISEKITFDEVGGLKEIKEELKEIVDFLKNPKKYLQIGARIPRGVLLMGAPGTGKTLLAKAIASTANVPFFSISASEVIELFVGVGSARIRSLFDQARKTNRAIIFIDEIDSIGKIRGVGATGGHEEREQTLNQLLSEMDGIGREEEILVFGATNRPEFLDPALLRPGRFDRRIILDLPDINEREEILKIHCRGKPLALNVNLREITERTSGFSGADLANVVNEAAILAARKNKNQIYQEEMLESIEKVLLGPERKSHILSKKEKEVAAFHETGHALISSSLSEMEPVRKISIIARGLAAGYTLKSPKEERKIKTKSEFLAEMATLLGGYCAEKLKFGEITTGASNDLERATQLAGKLVKEYGMSSLGPISFGEREELAFLGREVERRTYSEKVAAKIDREIEKFVKDAENTAQKILTKKKNLLEKIAKTLIEKETIEKKEFEELVGEDKTSVQHLLSKKEKPIKVKIKKV